MLKKFICLLIAFVSMIATAIPAAALTTPPAITSVSAIVFEPVRGQTVYEKEKNKIVNTFIAGDIMTVLVAIEKSDSLDTLVTISKEATMVNGIRMYYEAGSKVPLIELLYALLLESANDAAYAIDEYLAQTPEKLIETFTSKAASLNMKNTVFKSSAGFYPDTQTSSAYDISLLMRYALTLPKFNEIIAARATPITVNNHTVTAVNRSRMYWMYDNVTGCIAQYSTSALQDAITVVSKDNTEFIAVSLGGSYELVFDDSIGLFNYAFGNFKTDLLVSKDQNISQVTIADKTVSLVSGKDTYYTFPIGEDFIKSIVVTTKPDLKLPVTTENVLGTAQYVLKDDTAIDVSLFPAQNVSEVKNTYLSFLDRLNQNRDILILIYILLAIGFLILVSKVVGLISGLIKKKPVG